MICLILRQLVDFLSNLRQLVDIFKFKALVDYFSSKVASGLFNVKDTGRFFNLRTFYFFKLHLQFAIASCSSGEGISKVIVPG